MGRSTPSRASIGVAALLALGVVLAHPLYAAPGGTLAGDSSVPAQNPLLLQSGACTPGPDAPCPTGEEPATTAPAPASKTAPSFALKDLDGKPVRFEPHPGMKPAVLVFWSTFCGSCMEEMPVLSRLLERYQGAKLQVLTVDVLPQDARLEEPARRQVIRKYFAQNRIRLPVVLDRKTGKEYVAAGAYRVTGTPTVIVIDRQGSVRWTHAGRIEPEELEAKIKSVIGS